MLKMLYAQNCTDYSYVIDKNTRLNGTTEGDNRLLKMLFFHTYTNYVYNVK